MKKLFAALSLLALAACAGRTPSPEPIIKTVEVVKPVLMPCVPKGFAPARVYVDADPALRAAADAAERYQLLWAGRAQRQARINELEIVVSGCAREGTK